MNIIAAELSSLKEDEMGMGVLKYRSVSVMGKCSMAATKEGSLYKDKQIYYIMEL